MLLDLIMLGGSVDSGQFLATYGESGVTFNAKAMCIDASGNIYICGTRATSSQGFVAKLDSLGNVTWQRSLDHVSDTITPTSITVDGSGNVYVGGTVGGSGTAQLFVAKYNSSGTIQFQSRYGPSSHAVDGCRKLHVGSDGNLYLLGAYSGGGSQLVAELYKMNTSGTSTWRKKMDLGAGRNLVWNDVLYDGTGELVVGAETNATDGTIGRLAQIASAGTSFNFQMQEGSHTASQLAVVRDSSGNFYTVEDNHLFSKFDSSGALQWENTYPNSPPGNMASRPGVGAIQNDIPWFPTVYQDTTSSAWVLALTSAGAISAQLKLQFASLSFDVVGLAVDATFIYLFLAGLVGGLSEPVATVLKLLKANPATGTFGGVTVSIPSNTIAAGSNSWASSSLSSPATDTNNDGTGSMTDASGSLSQRTTQGL